MTSEEYYMEKIKEINAKKVSICQKLNYWEGECEKIKTANKNLLKEGDRISTSRLFRKRRSENFGKLQWDKYYRVRNDLSEINSKIIDLHVALQGYYKDIEFYQKMIKDLKNKKRDPKDLPGGWMNSDNPNFDMWMGM